jgi:hypothetical protein
VNVCQPASGCHVTGDLCTKDTDCCGGDPKSGLPGAGHVKCQIPDGLQVGICRNPMACNPEGNVCHFKDYACSISSARADCCGDLGAKGSCALDALGVPRCYGIGACRDAGQTCASAADCCDNVPCTPDASGKLICANVGDGPKCVPGGSNCTIDGDCCPGSGCLRPPGSTSGVCSAPPSGSGGSGSGGGDAGGASSGGSTVAGGSNGGSSNSNGGNASSGTGGAAGSGGGSGPTCASYGQLCVTSSSCCNDVPCNAGICRFFTP